MNEGLRELRAFTKEFEEEQFKAEFQKSVYDRLYESDGIMPIGIVKYNVPYVTLTMSLDDFKENVRWVGFKPSWDSNWGTYTLLYHC